MIKKIISIALIICISLSNVVITYGATSVAKVTSVEGTVKVKRAGSSKEFSAFENMTLSKGDTVKTGKDGSIKITTNDVNTISAGKNTSFTITKLSKANDAPENTYVVNYGTVYNEVNKKGFKKDSYKVKTSNTVMGVRGTVFAVTKELDSTGTENIDLNTLSGVVAVSEKDPNDISNEFKEVASVTAGETISFSENNPNSGTVEKIDITKLNIEELKWLEQNKNLLTPEQIEKVTETHEQLIITGKDRLEPIKENTSIDEDDDSDDTPITGGGDNDVGGNVDTGRDLSDFNTVTPTVDTVRDLSDITTTTPTVDIVRDLSNITTVTPTVDTVRDLSDITTTTPTVDTVKDLSDITTITPTVDTIRDLSDITTITPTVDTVKDLSDIDTLTPNIPVIEEDSTRPSVYINTYDEYRQVDLDLVNGLYPNGCIIYIQNNLNLVPEGYTGQSITLTDDNYYRTAIFGVSEFNYNVTVILGYYQVIMPLT